MKHLILIWILVFAPTLGRADESVKARPNTDKVEVFKIEKSATQVSEKWVDHALGVVCYVTSGYQGQAGQGISCLKFR